MKSNKVNSVKYQIFHSYTKPQYKIISKNNFTYKDIIAMIDRYLKPGMKILDIGCGAGTLSLYYASKGHDVVGIDIANNAIEACKISAKIHDLRNVKFEVVNFPNKFPKKKFDFIIFSEVIEHIENDKRALENISKLLNKGGLVFISTPSLNAPLYKLGLATNFDKRVGHVRRYNIQKLKELCENTGLVVVEVKKSEGLIRNFLFLNKFAGKFVRFIRFFITDIIMFLDNIALKAFGESNIFLVAKKLK